MVCSFLTIYLRCRWNESVKQCIFYVKYNKFPFSICGKYRFSIKNLLFQQSCRTLHQWLSDRSYTLFFLKKIERKFKLINKNKQFFIKYLYAFLNTCTLCSFIDLSHHTLIQWLIEEKNSRKKWQWP